MPLSPGWAGVLAVSPSEAMVREKQKKVEVKDTLQSIRVTSSLEPPPGAEDDLHRQSGVGPLGRSKCSRTALKRITPIQKKPVLLKHFVCESKLARRGLFHDVYLYLSISRLGWAPVVGSVAPPT